MSADENQISMAGGDGEAVGVLAEVAAERLRQDAKWGEQNHPNGTGAHTTPVAEIVRGKGSAVVNRHYASGLALQAKAATDRHAADGTVTYADILLEEVFEALAEEDPGNLRTELIQVAAVAAQWVEAIDRAAARSMSDTTPTIQAWTTENAEAVVWGTHDLAIAKEAYAAMELDTEPDWDDVRLMWGAPHLGEQEGYWDGSEYGEEPREGWIPYMVYGF